MRIFDNRNEILYSPAEPLPGTQRFMLGLIMLGYPLLSYLLNYLNPPSEAVIVSRIAQLYLPAIFFQFVIFFGIIWSLVWTIRRDIDISGRISESFAQLGIRRADLSFLNLAAGVIFLFLAIIILNIISNIVGYYGLFQAEDIRYLLPRTPLEKGFWIVLSLSAGITEEICFRGYVITRMARITGSVWPGAVLGAISFGIGHLYQGWGGAVMIMIYGFLFSLLFLARGSLIPCIIAHALQDMLAAFAM
jgi:membrane protease YdiL (CAAX protease family)